MGNWVWPNDGMDGVRMRSFIVRFVFVSDTACRVPTAVVTTPLHTGRGRGEGPFHSFFTTSAGWILLTFHILWLMVSRVTATTIVMERKR